MELTAAELWARVQELVRASVPEHSFNTWIASATAVAATREELVLEAQNPFHVEWLEDKFGALLDAAAARVVGRPLRVSVTAASSTPPPIPFPAVEIAEPRPAPPVGHAQAPASAAGKPVLGGGPARPRPLLNERYTFDRFVVGANNQPGIGRASRT